MECAQLGELAQILLDDGRVVLKEEPLQILRYEAKQAKKGEFCQEERGRVVLELRIAG